MSALTIKELRELLDKIPLEQDGFPVFLQTDPEGNGYHQVSGLDIGMWTGDNEYRPEDIHGSEAEENPEDYFLDEGEYEANCFVVYP